MRMAWSCSFSAYVEFSMELELVLLRSWFIIYLFKGFTDFSLLWWQIEVFCIVLLDARLCCTRMEQMSGNVGICVGGRNQIEIPHLHRRSFYYCHSSKGNYVLCRYLILLHTYKQIVVIRLTANTSHFADDYPMACRTYVDVK